MCRGQLLSCLLGVSCDATQVHVSDLKGFTLKRARTSLQLLIAAAITLLLTLSSTAAANALAFSKFIPVDFTDGGFAVTSPTGDTVALSTYGDAGNNVPPKLFIIDVATDAVDLVSDPDTHIQEGGQPAYSPDGGTIYLPTAKNDPGIAIVDVGSRTVTGFIDGTTLTPALDTPWLAQVSPDGETLYVLNYGASSSTDDASVFIIDILSGQVISTVPVPHAGKASNMFLSPDGTRLTLLKYGDGTDNVAIDVVTLGATPTVAKLDIAGEDMGSGFWSGCVSPDGNTLYVPNHQRAESGTDPNVIYEDDFVLAVSLLDGTAERSEVLNLPAAFTMCAVSEDGSTLYVTDQDTVDPTPLTTFSTSTLQHLETIELTGLSYGEGIAVAGSKAYVAGYYGGIAVLTGLPTLPDTDESSQQANPQLANTGSPSDTNTVTAALAATVALIFGAAAALATRARLRQRK